MDAAHKLDSALGVYYAQRGRHDYFDEYGRGKFLAFFEDNEFDNDHLEEAMCGDPDDCLFTDFDDDFPMQHGAASSIFDILSHCHRHGVAPPCASAPARPMASDAVSESELSLMQLEPDAIGEAAQRVEFESALALKRTADEAMRGGKLKAALKHYSQMLVHVGCGGARPLSAFCNAECVAVDSPVDVAMDELREFAFLRMGEVRKVCTCDVCASFECCVAVCLRPRTCRRCAATKFAT